MSNEIKQINLNIPVQKQAPKEEKPVVIDNSIQKDSSKTQYLKMAAVLFSGALIACGGIGLANKAYSKFSNDFILSSRVRKKDISQELFTFLKRYLDEEQGKPFTKSQIKRLNEMIDKDNLPIFKTLLKTNLTQAIESDEIVSIVEAMNKNNSGFVVDIAKKYDYGYGYNNGDIAKILNSINEDNSEFVNTFLAKVNSWRSKEETSMAEELAEHLGKITKSNAKEYAFVTGLRKNGKYTSFEIDEIHNLAKAFKKGQNEECFKYLSSLKATNGVDYRFNGEELNEMLQNAQDEFIDLYRTCVEKYKDDAKDIISKITKDNKEIYELLIDTQNKTATTNYSANDICEIAEQSVNQNNIETLKFLINLKDDGRFVFDFSNSLITCLNKADDRYLDVYQALDLNSLYSFAKDYTYKDLFNAVNEDNIEFIRAHFSKITQSDLRFIQGLKAERIKFAEEFIQYSNSKNAKFDDSILLLKQLHDILDEYPEKADEIYQKMHEEMTSNQKWEYFKWRKIIDEFDT